MRYVAALRFFKGAVPLGQGLGAGGGVVGPGLGRGQALLGAFFCKQQPLAQVDVFALELFLLLAQLMKLLFQLALLGFPGGLGTELVVLQCGQGLAQVQYGVYQQVRRSTPGIWRATQRQE